MAGLGRCRSVDEYERLNRIGQGTYGTVYRAREKTTGQIVALKRVILHNEEQDGVRFRFHSVMLAQFLVSSHRSP